MTSKRVNKYTKINDFARRFIDVTIQNGACDVYGNEEIYIWLVKSWVEIGEKICGLKTNSEEKSKICKEIFDSYFGKNAEKMLIEISRECLI